MNSLILASFGSVMMNILYVIIAIVVLLTMVLIHELGHYIVGRLLGFKITEFSIGFGKALWQRKNKRGELISFRIFPLGGYCAFLGETDDDEPKKEEEKQEDNKVGVVQTSSSKKHCIYCDAIIGIDEDKCSVCGAMQKDIIDKNAIAESAVLVDKKKGKQSKLNKNGRYVYDESEGKFNEMRPWKRILVYFAGVTFNFISAFIFAIIFLCVGGYDGYKISPSNDYVVSYYSAETGEFLGVLQNETIISAINGIEVNYAKGQVFDKIVSSDATEITLTLANGYIKDIIIKKEARPVKQEDGTFKDEVIFGISYSSYNISYNFGDVLRDFVPFTFHLAFMVLEAFWWIISGQIALNQLGGPISTISQMTMVASYGLANFLYLLPLLAANLAIFNILPIPGLDGAHVIFTGIEWIRGKPIKRSVENAIHGWGILLLFAFVIIIDVVHLITV
ncbi:MAG: site-2 protease family protein [Clostridia bacterium]|nr:site-2 protease family protein [Clostridia bacterium]